MKKRLIFATILCLLLSGCCGPEKQLPTVPDQCLRVCIPTDAPFWTPFLREFEYRTGIWVRTVQEAAPSSEVEADVLLGFAAQDLRPVSDHLTRQITVGWQVPVIVCNPHLIRRNPPAGFLGLSDPQWAQSLSFADPEKSSFSRCVLELLSRMEDGASSEQRIRAFAEAVSGLSDSTQAALRDVCNGTTALGLVPESEALLAGAQGIRLSVIYPEEGSYLLPISAAISAKSTDPESAEAFIRFLLEDSVQSQLWIACRIRPAEGPEFPNNPMTAELSDARSALQLWKQILEVQP